MAVNFGVAPVIKMGGSEISRLGDTYSSAIANRKQAEDLKRKQQMEQQRFDLEQQQFQSNQQVRDLQVADMQRQELERKNLVAFEAESAQLENANNASGIPWQETLAGTKMLADQYLSPAQRKSYNQDIITKATFALERGKENPEIRDRTATILNSVLGYNFTGDDMKDPQKLKTVFTNDGHIISVDEGTGDVVKRGDSKTPEQRKTFDAQQAQDRQLKVSESQARKAASYSSVSANQALADERKYKMAELKKDDIAAEKERLDMQRVHQKINAEREKSTMSDIDATRRFAIEMQNLGYSDAAQKAQEYGVKLRTIEAAKGREAGRTDRKAKDVEVKREALSLKAKLGWGKLSLVQAKQKSNEITSRLKDKLTVEQTNLYKSKVSRSQTAGEVEDATSMAMAYAKLNNIEAGTAKTKRQTLNIGERLELSKQAQADRKLQITSEIEFKGAKIKDMIANTNIRKLAQVATDKHKTKVYELDKERLKLEKLKTHVYTMNMEGNISKKKTENEMAKIELANMKLDHKERIAATEANKGMMKAVILDAKLSPGEKRNVDMWKKSYFDAQSKIDTLEAKRAEITSYIEKEKNDPAYSALNPKKKLDVMTALQKALNQPNIPRDYNSMLKLVNERLQKKNDLLLSLDGSLSGYIDMSPYRQSSTPTNTIPPNPTQRQTKYSGLANRLRQNANK